MVRRSCSPLVLVALSLATAQARAQTPPAPPEDKEQRPIEITVRGRRPGQDTAVAGRAITQVTRRDLDERQPRSAPDALRYEPGVFVQQTAHGQASAFLRGRTGQQTVLLFDGIRMNTSTWRQGPNQYFFTVDTKTIQRIDVVRGGASTLYGSDAIGGVIDSIPIEPRRDDSVSWRVRPRTFLRYASADASFGERFQLDTQVSDRLQVMTGAGYQRVGELRSGGPIYSPVTGAQALVPVFGADGKTQRGTGFREVTGDVRAVYWLSNTRKVTAAAYMYREYDAPRTDQCPAPGAPLGECLKTDEQFRTLAYAAYDGDLGKAAAKARVALSFQRQHERRTLARPAPAYTNLGGRDDVNTFGLTGKAMSHWFAVADGVKARVHYGADGYVDRVSSNAYMEFTNLDLLLYQSRGQYIQGSGYEQGGLHAVGEAAFGERVTVRAGTRGGFARAHAPADPESGTEPVNRTWPLVAGMAGAEIRLHPRVALLANFDRSVRAPNLDDLTSRQQTGPGFQWENASLRPETGTTWEGGLRLGNRRLTVEGWLYRTSLHDAMTRGIRSAADCPPNTPQCGASARRVQLVNVAGISVIQGAEAWMRLRLMRDLAQLTASISYAVGEGPSPATPDDPDAAREPLSRIPPLNGTAELRVGRPIGPFAGAGLRWARAHTRLATVDQGDARIPLGGTPGFAVLDLRAGYRFGRELVAMLAVENITDSAYRYHGSSINGPGRGVIAALEAGLP